MIKNSFASNWKEQKKLIQNSNFFSPNQIEEKIDQFNLLSIRPISMLSKNEKKRDQKQKKHQFIRPHTSFGNRPKNQFQNSKTKSFSKVEKKMTESQALLNCVFDQNYRIIPFKFQMFYAKISPHSFYQLDPVSKREIINQNKYAVISRKGITIYENKMSEFVPIKIWIKEKYSFKLISKIPTFKNFFLHRFFGILLKNSRKERFQRKRNKISKSPLFRNFLFRDFLVRINSICINKIVPTPLFTIQNPQNAYSIEKILQTQETQTKIVKKEMKNILQVIHQIILETIRKISDPKRSKIDEKMLEKFEKRNPKKDQIIKQFEEKIKMERELAKQINEEIYYLSKFIRLVDFLVFDSLQKAIENGINQIDEILIQKLLSIFKVEVEIPFQFQISEIKSQVLGMVLNTSNEVLSLPRIRKKEEFKDFFSVNQIENEEIDFGLKNKIEKILKRIDSENFQKKF
ncbi:dynein heavy chain family protein [Anaeramoeba ignava]|uniref:Dynein heavy chain family protein n=1 Tax=Anaeramoeba ignava TaxID=1746090 RepID=A0A9Q0LPT6_ANAIG|nr:dynein heavy chain family protein [Anaeramoeba ignava]